MNRPARVRRVFLWRGERLADPDPSLTPEQVLDWYSTQYPELTTAVVSPVENTDGKEIRSFEPKPKAAVAAVATSGTKTYQVEQSQGKRG